MKGTACVLVAAVAVGLGGCYAYPSSKRRHLLDADALRRGGNRRHLEDGHGHDEEDHDEKEDCGCEGDESDHPFVIDCSRDDFAAVAATLSACPITEAGCAARNAQGIQECQQAFFILQSHHDYCLHDTLTTDQEELVHDYEGVCKECKVQRKPVEGRKQCPMVNCEDSAVANLALKDLMNVCGTNATDPIVNGTNATKCCTNEAEQGAFEVIYGYHEQCEHDQVPDALEDELHHVEEDCEDYLCNNVAADYDPNVCPETAWQAEARAANWRPCGGEKPDDDHAEEAGHANERRRKLSRKSGDDDDAEA